MLWIGAIVAVLFATSILVIGTESGSRWVLDKVTGKITGLGAEAISGTLLTGLEIGRADYETPKFTITITQLKIDFSWSRSSPLVSA